MCALTQVHGGQSCRIISIKGDKRFISRITSVGLTPGSEVEMMQNEGRHPLLVYARDSMLAVNKKEAENILVEVFGA